ncbi:Hydroxyacylglutathione hydrolase [Candidatus Hartigia pinicola]|nr:Hydroxyacylglutathione hydrolase [Candidatus Hartigia pinicola]
MDLIRIPVLNDNYIWLISNNYRQCVIIDPTESELILKIIIQKKFIPKAILLTHHHNDHTGGVMGILSVFRNLPIFGPEETRTKGATQIVEDGDGVKIENFYFDIIGLPGHTLGHVGFYRSPYLFCGDTLFSGGCGRIFEGTPEQMYYSIQKISALPDNTLICCAHEYTQSNLNFAHYIWPENITICQYLNEVSIKRSKNQPTVPSTLKIERKINLFLQCNNRILKKKLKINSLNTSPKTVFIMLRQFKNQY